MSMEEPEILEKLFSLAENPFDPKIDTIRDFNFLDYGVGLMNELEIFRIFKLKEYFHKLGTFDKAITTIQNYIRSSRYPQVKTPPTILIQGSAKAGKSTTANYVADYIREIMKPIVPNLRPISLKSYNFAEFLWQVKLVFQTHVNSRHRGEYETVFETYDKAIDITDPNETVLTLLFQSFEGENISPLILIIEPIDIKRENWIYQFHEIFRKINVVPIYITTERGIMQYFSNKVDKGSISGVSVEIAGLNEQDAFKLLENRLDLFRLKNTQVQRKGIFPFQEETINQQYLSESQIEIGKLLRRLHKAFDEKINELKNSSITAATDISELLIKKEHIKESIRNEVKNIFESRD